MWCPICDEKLKEEYLDCYNGIVHESLYFCEAKDHEFSEDYAFGTTVTRFGDKTLHHHYSYDDAKNNEYHEKYEFYVWMEKKKLEEKNKKEDE